MKEKLKVMLYDKYFWLLSSRKTSKDCECYLILFTNQKMILNERQ